MSSLLEMIKAKKASIASGNRRKTVKPTAGTTRWRILPSWRKDDEQFWHDFGQHFVKDASGKISAVYVCTEKTFGKPCPVCDAVRTATKSATDDVTMNILKQAGSSGRVLMNAIQLGEGKDPNAVEILELGSTVFAQLIEISEEWLSAGEGFFDPVNGKDVMITRTGEGIGTKYVMQVSAKSTKLSPSVLEKLHNLDEYVAQESAEAQLRAINSVRAVAGLLPAPSGATPALGAGGPARSLAGVAPLDEEDEFAAATPPKRAAAPVADVEDVAPRPVAAKPAPKATVAAEAHVAAASDAGDAELDDILAQLDAAGSTD